MMHRLLLRQVQQRRFDCRRKVARQMVQQQVELELLMPSDREGEVQVQHWHRPAGQLAPTAMMAAMAPLRFRLGSFNACPLPMLLPLSTTLAGSWNVLTGGTSLTRSSVSASAELRSVDQTLILRIAVTTHLQAAEAAEARQPALI